MTAQGLAQAPELSARFDSAAGHAAYVERSAPLRAFKTEAFGRLFRARRPLAVWLPHRKGSVPGFSSPAGRPVEFVIYLQRRRAEIARNLRETLLCPVTGFNARMRAAIAAVAAHEPGPFDGYIMEQKTPLYAHFAERHPGLAGSEYLSEDAVPGSISADGLRHEDATRLTFADASFDVVMSFEVFEHIPDYRAALAEVRRVLRPGGRFYLSVPFDPGVHGHLERARVEDGRIVHLEEPEYHGDPIRGEGILCFRHFGWALFDDLAAAGFRSVEALAFDRIEYGYYGLEPELVFRAVV